MGKRHGSKRTVLPCFFTTMTSPRVSAPTIDDLRVKTCYVCQEEEHWNSATPSSPQPWVHPCQCTLVAHEKCLLQWIRAAQKNKPSEPVKCPQCGFIYEWESDRPLIFRVLQVGNRVLEAGGTLIVAGLVGGVLGGTVAGTVIAMTAYGAHAIYRFFGSEMFSLVLSPDFRKWPLTVWLNLPTIPLMLLVSRAGLNTPRAPLETLLAFWPAIVPISLANKKVVFGSDPWESGLNRPLWPPPISIYGLFLVPAVKRMYSDIRSRATEWVMGPSRRNERSRGGRGDDREFVLQIGAMPMFLRLQEREAPRAPVEQQEGVELAEPEPNAPVIENAPEAFQEEPEDGVDNQRNISLATVGRWLGGALLAPTVSSMMGSLLLRLSRHSSLLHRILGVRPPLTSYERQLVSFLDIPDSASMPTVIVRSIRYSVGLMIFGYEPWSRADPVWLRNSIGLGLFVFLRDTVMLANLYLAKRELMTRRVRSRDFRGIDVTTLELVDPAKFGLVPNSTTDASASRPDPTPS
ncbi:hypothetical protein DL96DRAFT_1618805, partial [Flagelloscypha sp. PMI_526]